MRSSSGKHFIALDHVRAVAVFMVIAWHFTHATNGFPVPFEHAPLVFPLAILDEGHTGVALFMTLSGYLFSKLLDKERINYRAFLWNRVLRLLPLLCIVFALAGASRVRAGMPASAYLNSIWLGAVYPPASVGLPNGGWSIVVEFHYYLLLPVFLWLLRRSRFLPFGIVLAAMIARAAVRSRMGEVQSLAYFTLLGRIDQFALGMLLFHFRDVFAGRHVLVGSILVAFFALFWLFDERGGYYQSPSYPSPSVLWVVLPTAEAVSYAVAIAWYESSFRPSNRGISWFLGQVGAYSYSIYLLHFFVVFRAAKFVHMHVMNLSNFYVACVWALLFLLAMTPVGYASFRLIEGPFLKWRKRYVEPALPETMSA